MRTAIMISIILFSAVRFSCAQSDQNETLTFTTYYPSPRGVYDRIRLQPRKAPQNPQEGEMYYDIDDHRAYIWFGPDKEWLPWDFSALPPPPLIPGLDDYVPTKVCNVSTGTDVKGVTMRALTQACTTYCRGEGHNMTSVDCTDRRIVRSDYDDYYTYFDYYTCSRRSPNDGYKDEYYCYGVGGKTLTRCNCEGANATSPGLPPVKACDIRTSTSVDGVTMTALKRACSMFCGGKGFAVQNLTCADERTETSNYRNVYTYYDFHECLQRSPNDGFAGDPICFSAGNTTNATCTCMEGEP